jgi:basic amino acid/polyamine antiporter, APA family
VAHEADRARRPLGFFSLLALGINGTIGVGIFFAPTEVAATTPGYTGAWVYVLTGLAMLPVAIVYGRLGGRFSEDGGPYVWARLAFGSVSAFLIGWLTYASALFSAATVATGLSEHLYKLMPAFPFAQKGLALACVGSLSLAVATGLRVSAMAWNVVTVLKLLPLIGLTLVAIFATLLGGASVPATTAAASDSSVMNIGRALLFVVFALQGFEVVPVLSGSTHQQRAVPWATVCSLVLCTLFYTVLHALCVHALPDLASQQQPLVAAAAVYGGGSIAAVLSVGQIVSAMGIAFGQFAVTPRYLSALGRIDALGDFFGKEDERRVPQRALWITTAGVVLLVLREDLTSLFALSSIAVLLQYAVATLALAVLAHRGYHGVDKRELGWALPALIGIALVAGGAEWKELITTAAVTALGGLLLALRGPRRRLADKSSGSNAA